MGNKIRSKIKTKILSIILLAAILIPQCAQSVWTLNAMAAESAKTVATDYFYQQLDGGNERIFYRTMVSMLKNGSLKKGNVSLEVTGLDTSKDEQTLLNEMGAARDAFMLDYPELFYIDFDALSLRIASDETHKHVYLGTGRSSTYINPEFLNDDNTVNDAKISDAISAVNSRIEAIVDQAKSQSPREQVITAHNAVIKAAAYKFEYQTEHPYSVRTVYGVFGLGTGDNTGNAVCEGYARALKAILDRLGVPAILVRGIYMNDGKPEEHMWVYVQLEDGQWYGVDPTFDNTDDKGGSISNEYLIVNDRDMPNHYPTGIISSSDKEFTYPAIDGGGSSEYPGHGAEDGVVYDADGIKVEYAQNEVVNGQKAEMVYHISYNGEGYRKAAEKGNYIVVNSWQMKRNDKTGKNDYLPTDWLYPVGVGDYPYEDHDEYVSVVMVGIYGFQVGITQLGLAEDPAEDNGWNIEYSGNTDGIEVLSSAIETGEGVSEYPQPFVKRTTPPITVKQRVGRTYNIAVEYDQAMEYKENNTEKKVGYEVLLYDRVYGYRAADESTMQFKISEPKLSEDGLTITYDFTPSKLWAYDDTEYIVKFTGIKGSISGKDPNSVGYVVYNTVTGCIYALRSMNIDIEAYGKPMLMDDFDLQDIVDPSSLDLSDEDQASLQAAMEAYGDLLKHRLALVTTTTTQDEDVQLKKLLDEELSANGRELAKEVTGKTRVETYNISLTLCRCQLEQLKDGTRIRIKLGFPEGYGPKDAGVTFKAYHYIDNGDGTYTIEEIPCTITELGLIIEVNAFSPFAIAALEYDAAQDKEDKVILLDSTDGGRILDEDGKRATSVVHVEDDDYRTFVAKADSAHKIDSMTINGETVEAATGETEYAFQIKAGSRAFISFIADDTGTEEEDRGDDDEESSSQTKPSAPDSGASKMLSDLATSNGFYISVAVTILAGAVLIIRRRKSA